MSYNSDSIVSLQGLEKVTQMPNIYVGNRSSNKSLFQMCKEVVDNSIDEASLVGDSCSIKIIFFYNKDKSVYQCVVIDTGRGIPVNKILPSFTEEATSGKYRIEGKQSAYKRSVGTFGRGSKAVAGLSKVCFVLSSQNKSDEGTGILLVKDSKIVKTTIDPKPLNNGTIVFHEPSSKYFDTISDFMTNGFSLFQDYIEFISAFESNANITIVFKEGLVNYSLFEKDVDVIYNYFHSIDGTNSKEKIILKTTKDLDHVEYMKSKLDIKGDVLYKDYIEYDDPDSLSFKINLLVDSNFESMNNIKFISAVNNSPISTQESHHIFVLLNVIKEKLYKFSDSPKIQKFIKENYKFPFYLSVNVYWNDVVYEDLLKLIYRDAVFSGAYYSALHKIFNSEQYSEKFYNLYDLLKDHIEDQYNKFTFKGVNISNIKNISSKLKKSSNFAPCKVKDKEQAELFIVEGTTAANLLNECRNPDTQAVLALGGKPINIMKKDVEIGIKNNIFKDLTMVLGLKPGDPIENINYKKIFIATDPDAHGAHITSLIIGNLYSINPEIFNMGYINIIISPKYSLTYKKYKTFIKDFNTLFSFKVKAIFKFLFDFKIVVEDSVIPIVREQDFYIFCKTIFNLSNLILSTAENLGIEPSKLELLVNNYEYLFDINNNRETLKQKFNCDDVKYDEETNILYLIKDKEDIIIPMKNVLKDIKNNILKEYYSLCVNKWYPLVTIKENKSIVDCPMTILQIYYLLEGSCKDLRVSKFKGLGSMNVKDAEPICMSPATRTYIRINSLGNVKTIIDMLGKDTNERKLL